MKGVVFFFEDQNESGTNHPWFVISDPDPENNVLIVNCARIKTGREDLSCKLEGGCHPNIHEDSYIAYYYAKEINILRIRYLEIRNLLTIKSNNISETLLKKTQEGAKISPLLSEQFEKYFIYF